MKRYTQFKKELLAIPLVKASYDELGPEYEVVQRVIRQRTLRKMSQKELARRVGTQQSAISRLESGSANPSLLFLHKVATALGTKLDVSFR